MRRIMAMAAVAVRKQHERAEDARPSNPKDRTP